VAGFFANQASTSLGKRFTTCLYSFATCPLPRRLVLPRRRRCRRLGWPALPAAPRFLIRRAPDPCDDDRPTMAATNPFDFEDEYSDSELPPDDDGRYDDAEEEEDDDDFDAWVRKPEQIAQVLAGSVGKQAEPRRCADMTRSWSTLQPCAPHTATLCL
jgi:hypothetical protein